MNPLTTLISADPTALARLRLGSQRQMWRLPETHAPSNTWDNRPSWDNWTKHK
ncbi:hypothetical protein GCM10009534_52170 [Kribbella sandramycini]